ncbi:MAG: hypothetical protein ACPL7K_01380 [Armatimonadota bacterium]
MTIPELAQEYGPFISDYAGRGHFAHTDGHDSDDVAFWSGQCPDGRIVLACRDIIVDLDTDPNTLSFVGTTDTGLSFNTNGRLVVTRWTQQGEDRETLLLCTQVDVGTYPPLRERLHIWCGLTNFEFWGTEGYAITPSSAVLAMPLNLRGSNSTYSARLVRRSDYDMKENTLTAGHGIVPTAELELVLESGDQSDNIDSVAADMCQILSIAKGARIQWIYRRIVKESGTVLLTRHVHRVTSDYSASAIIGSRPRDGATMKLFIETAFPAFIRQRDSYELDKGVVNTYLDAKSDHDFIESRELKFAVAAEMLAHANLRATSHERYEAIMSQDDFQNCLPDLETCVKNCLTARNISQKTAKRIASRAKELNNTPFADILDQLFRGIGLTTARGDVKLFASCRNSLVHTGQSLSTNRPPDRDCPFAAGWAGSVQEYFFMQSLIDRTFLRILDYDGPYLDCRIDWGDLEAHGPPIPRAHVNDLANPE